MRERKIRVWHGWLKGKYMYGEEALRWYYQNRLQFYNHEKINDTIFEDFTGLTDPNRNNADVYEGDIYEWGGMQFPIDINQFHGFRFMWGSDQLVKAYIVSGKYIGTIHEESK